MSEKEGVEAGEHYGWEEVYEMYGCPTSYDEAQGEPSHDASSG